MKQVIFSLLLLLCVGTTYSFKLWPQPQSVTQGNLTVGFSIGDFSSVLAQNLTSEVLNKINFYSIKIYGQSLLQDSVFANIQQLKNRQQTFFINIENPSVSFPKLEETDESYTLTAYADGTVDLNANTYFGFVHGLETFSQILRQNLDEPSTTLTGLPFTIVDKPHFVYRAVMIDTARNFLLKSSILRTLDAMMYSKLNVLHWHITDDESFPIELPSIPQMADDGSYGIKYRYSTSDVQEIVQYAAENAIRVIPEIDSPGHVRSWGRSQKYQNITIACNGGEHYNNQLDPTLDLTYEANDLIFKDIQALFPEQLIHMGGDEAFASCWKLRPSIQTFMTAHNISSYDDLQVYYRNRQKKSIQANRTKIYWANDVLHIPPAPEDVIQFWGNADTYDVISGLPNKVILSPQDFLYINSGINFIWGNFFGNFTTWLNIYQVNLSPSQFDPSKILGAETTLWGEVNTDSTLDVYLWARSSALAERLWTGNHLTKSTLAINMTDIATRLSFMEDLLVQRGIQAAPITNRFCKQNIDTCFGWRTANVYSDALSSSEQEE